MQNLIAHATLINQFQRDIIILIALQSRAQTVHFHRVRQTHLDARVKAF